MWLSQKGTWKRGKSRTIRLSIPTDEPVIENILKPKSLHWWHSLVGCKKHGSYICLIKMQKAIT